MKNYKLVYLLGLLLISTAIFSCSKGSSQTPVTPEVKPYDWQVFVMGADLSYVNQIENSGGKYTEGGKQTDPFLIFRNHGTNTVRVRLWHNPSWELPITGGKLYSDLYDVEKTIRRAKENGMVVNLDIHYSDDWVDPSNQNIPAAWQGLSLNILKDSVYNYTTNVLNYLKSKNLVPEMVQVGNETNAGMLWPTGKVVADDWKNFGVLLNSGIKAVRDFSVTSTIKPQIILHVAQLQNADYWCNGITAKGGVTDFDIIGLSHYYKWSSINSMSAIGSTISALKTKYGKKVMIVETAFPWTNDNADSYNNLFYSTTPVEGYYVSKSGQLQYLKDLTQTLITAGASGLMYWEPAWITSPMKDRWGTGSSWENNAYFDFSGEVISNIDFMKYAYKF